MRWRVLLELLTFYAATWLIGGLGLYFMVRSVGGDPPLSSVPFLGGVSAVGAIVAVLAVFAPSGLGPREATMYGLTLALTTDSVALAAIHGVETVAFPAISTGVYGYPKAEGARIAVATLKLALPRHPSIRQVRLVFFSEDDRKLVPGTGF